MTVVQVCGVAGEVSRVPSPSTAPFAFGPSLAHQDLDMNCLIDAETGELSGLIDFGGTVVANPALDLWLPLYGFARLGIEDQLEECLKAAGIDDEPVSWSPPADCVAGLTLPGREPDDTTVLRLRQRATLATRDEKTHYPLAVLAAQWQHRAATVLGVDDHTIDRLRDVRNAYYQEYLRTEAIEIDEVMERDEFQRLVAPPAARPAGPFEPARRRRHLAARRCRPERAGRRNGAAWRGITGGALTAGWGWKREAPIFSSPSIPRADAWWSSR